MLCTLFSNSASECATCVYSEVFTTHKPHGFAKYFNVTWVRNTCYWCGHYAVAFTVAICAGLDPTLMRFDATTIAQYVRDGLQAGCFSNSYPAVPTTGRQDICIVNELKLHCICQSPYSKTPMIICRVCGNNYHPSCVSVQYEVCPPLMWQGPCCDGVMSQQEFVPDPADEEVVVSADDVYSTSSPFNAGNRGRRPNLQLDLSDITEMENC